MDMNFEANGVFTVSMVPYIATTIKDFPEIIASSAPTPHMDNLFKVRDASNQVPSYITLLPGHMSKA